MFKIWNAKRLIVVIWLNPFTQDKNAIIPTPNAPPNANKNAIIFLDETATSAPCIAETKPFAVPS